MDKIIIIKRKIIHVLDILSKKKMYLI